MGTHRGQGEARPSGAYLPFLRIHILKRGLQSSSRGQMVVSMGGTGLGVGTALERLTEVHMVQAPEKTFAEICPGLKRE